MTVDARYKVASIPYPFKTREQYERSLQRALGQEWNTLNTMKKSIRPEVGSETFVVCCSVVILVGIVQWSHRCRNLYCVAGLDPCRCDNRTAAKAKKEERKETGGKVKNHTRVHDKIKR